jgi:Flp pilus assembly protein TadG
VKRDERGAITVWVAMAISILVLVIGITVDLTGQVNAQQHSFEMAQQAGRAAANQVATSQVMAGDNPTIDISAASTAAASYLTAAAVEGEVTVTGPTSLHVHVTTVYQPRFLGSVGVGAKTVSGDTDVELARVVNGTQR